MKKVLYSIALMMVAVFSSVLLTACGDPEPKELKVKTGSIETTVLVNTEHDLSGLVVQVVYDNGDTKDVNKNDDMVITPINTNQLGKQNLVIKYLGLSTSVEINVVATEGDLYRIAGFEKPLFYTEYQNSVATASATVDAEFAKGDSTYKVGDDNDFIFLPVITALNEDGDDFTITEYTSKVTVKENNTELTGTALTNVVEVKNTESAFDFTEAAIGRTFQITVQPETIPANATYGPITFTVEVVDGWNVYDEANLSRIENNANTASTWATFKQQNNIGNEAINAVVLHRDMEIKKSDLPTGYFHAAGAVDGNGHDVSGTLKDSTSLYTRDINPGETFAIYGNYFQIKTRNEGNDALPMVKHFTHDDYMSHAALFSFGGDNEGSPDDAQGNVKLYDLSLKGNGSQQADTEATNEGGLIGIITSAENTLLENCLTRSFTTHIIALDGDGAIQGINTCKVSNSKMIDSFSTMFLSWASKNNVIENSVIKSAGGATVCAIHVDPDESTARYSNVEIKNSVIENHVGGNEAWFNFNDATAIANYIKAISTIVKTTSENLIGTVDGLEYASSFTNTSGAFNFYALSMADGNAFLNTSTLYNTTTIKDAEGNVLSQQTMNDPVVSAIGSVNSALLAMPIFKVGDVYVTLNIDAALTNPDNALTGLSLLITDPEMLQTLSEAMGTELNFAYISLNDIKDSSTQSGYIYSVLKASLDEKIASFFNGDYVHMFYGGTTMGATFGMFHEA